VESLLPDTHGLLIPQNIEIGKWIPSHKLHDADTRLFLREKLEGRSTVHVVNSGQLTREWSAKRSVADVCTVSHVVQVNECSSGNVILDTKLLTGCSCISWLLVCQSLSTHWLINPSQSSFRAWSRNIQNRVNNKSLCDARAIEFHVLPDLSSSIAAKSKKLVLSFA